jgi:hypothetical protein
MMKIDFSQEKPKVRLTGQTFHRNSDLLVKPSIVVLGSAVCYLFSRFFFRLRVKHSKRV